MLTDSFNRKIDYLRLSLTDRCNLRCVYCMPKDAASFAPQKEMLSDVLDVYSAGISNRMAFISNSLNKTMKFLTALTLIIMIPTLLASIYGMNFKFIPLADGQYGFYIILGLMAISLLATLSYFWRKKWL